MKRHRWSIAKAVWMFAILSLISTAQICNANVGPITCGPTIFQIYEFDPGWHVQDSEEWSGGLGLFGLFSVSSTLHYDYFAGVSTPIRMNVSYPEWLIPGADFNFSACVEGLEGGRAGIYFDAGIEITFAAFGSSWDVVNSEKNLDLSVEYRTPIGSELSRPMTAKVSLGQISIPIVGYTIDVYFGAEAQLEFETVLQSQITAESVSLEEQVNRQIEWTEQKQKIVAALQTKPTASSPVKVGLKETQLLLVGLSVRLTSLFIEFQAPGFDPARLTIDLPEISLPILGGSSRAMILADNAEHRANLELDSTSIPVRVSSQTNPSGSFPTPLIALVVVLLSAASLCIVIRGRNRT